MKPIYKPKYYHRTKTMGIELLPEEKRRLARENTKMAKEYKDANNSSA